MWLLPLLKFMSVWKRSCLLIIWRQVTQKRNYDTEVVNIYSKYKENTNYTWTINKNIGFELTRKYKLLYREQGLLKSK